MNQQLSFDFLETNFDNPIDKKIDVPASYLDEESQRDLVDIIDNTDVFLSFSQTVRMRKRKNSKWRNIKLYGNA